MKRTGKIFTGVGAFIGMVAFAFIIGGISIIYYWLYAPMRKGVERKVFEETKSYTHGKIQDLTKYFDEYQRTSDPTEREAIRYLIRQRFAEFDESNIRAEKLRNFLVAMRGY